MNAIKHQFSEFDYHFLFKVVPYLCGDTFGFWRIWYAEYELYYSHFLRLASNHTQATKPKP